MIAALVSDFGGVLTTPLFQAFAAVQDDTGITGPQLRDAMRSLTESRGENPLFPLERGEMSEAEFMGLLSGELGVELHRFAETYFEALAPNEELFAYYRGLRERGVRLAMLTNNVREWEARWRAMLPIDEVFELVVDSAFVGMRKPDPRIYGLTLSRLGLEAGACAFVDDLEVNVEAASAVGLQAIRFETNEQVMAEIDALLS